MSDSSITIKRTTKETDITAVLDLEKRGEITINTTLPFFDHMLHAMAFHGGFSLSLNATGDTDVDPHHLVEDAGLVLGSAFYKVFEKFSPLARYGFFRVPMDDALADVTIDACNRPYLVYNIDFPQERSGQFDMFLLKEFFQAFTANSRINLHINCLYGENSHHMSEAVFKAFGRALNYSFTRISTNSGNLSTKGLL
ncbi:MAG: imidazoleglycerol-phosphate dehydratase HisB [Spirochaetales bacterium]|nr:imidazoleglycerol-phosphate dehydratase HisB [Spirochaetales bacterium]